MSGNTKRMKTLTVNDHLARNHEIANEVAAGTPYAITGEGRLWLTLTRALVKHASWPPGVGGKGLLLLL